MPEAETTDHKVRTCANRLRAILPSTFPDPAQPEYEELMRVVREVIADLAALPARDLDAVVHKARALGDLGTLVLQADAETLYWTSRLAESLTEDIRLRIHKVL